MSFFFVGIHLFSTCVKNYYNMQKRDFNTFSKIKSLPVDNVTKLRKACYSEPVCGLVRNDNELNDIVPNGRDFCYLFLLLSKRFLATLMGPSVIWLIQARLLPQP